MTITRAPRWLRSRSVGRAARTRVSSATAPSSRGTFRSSRTSTRLLRMSTSRYERTLVLGLETGHYRRSAM